MNTSERANQLVRFFGTEFSRMEPEVGVDKLESLISKYVKFEGRYTGIGVVEAKDLERWQNTLDIYNKIGGIVFSLEKNYPNCYEAISNFFDLKMVEVFLTAVIMKGSKVFSEIQDKQRITLDRKKLLEEDKFFEPEHLKIVEDFLKNPMPLTREDEPEKISIDELQNIKEKEKFFEKGQIAYWYLVYYFALLQHEKEILQDKQVNTELSKVEEKTKSMMYEFVQHSRERQADSRGR